jgi:endonuclease YncB( thermonuclease family)
MVEAVGEAIKTIWIETREGLRLSRWEFAVSLFSGSLIYVIGWVLIEKIRARIKDPMSGGSLLSLLGIQPVAKRSLRGKVTKVFDGDTIEVGGSRVVRIIGIDAPEKEENEKCFRDAKMTGLRPEKIVRQGKEATEWLENELKGMQVELELDQEAGRRDQYDRLLAHVWMLGVEGSQKMLVGSRLVWAGHALPTTHDHKYKGRIEKMWDRAKKEGKGKELGVPDPNQWSREGASTNGVSSDRVSSDRVSSGRSIEFTQEEKRKERPDGKNRKAGKDKRDNKERSKSDNTEKTIRNTWMGYSLDEILQSGTSETATSETGTSAEQENEKGGSSSSKETSPREGASKESSSVESSSVEPPAKDTGSKEKKSAGSDGLKDSRVTDDEDTAGEDGEGSDAGDDSEMNDEQDSTVMNPGYERPS